jgi:hypothetical protein
VLGAVFLLACRWKMAIYDLQRIRCRRCIEIALGRDIYPKSHLSLNRNRHEISAATCIVIVVAIQANPTSGHSVVTAAFAANPIG